MTALFYGLIVAIAIVLFIFTGIWGGLVWLVVAALALGAVFIGKARTVESTKIEPTGVPRASHSDVETTNERVGQP